MPEREIRPGIRRLVRLALRRDARARDEMDDEIRLHLALRAEQLVQAGMAPDEARREAERRFGAVDAERARLKASATRRDSWLRWREWAQGVRQGLVATARGMRRSPGFVAIAVTCIALGVGANAAAYSLFDELVLRALPVREPARLVNLASPGSNLGSDMCNQSGTCDEVYSLPMFRDLERAAPGAGLAGLAAHRLFLASIAHDGQAEQGDATFVSGRYFPLLGLRPAAGRLLGPADDAAPGAAPVAVVSHAFWRTRLGADPGAVGRTLLVNGRTLTIVGVAPEGFEGTTVGVRPWLYVPVSMSVEVDPFFGSRKDLEDRSRYWLYAFGRLAPGTTREQAQARLTTTYRGILRAVELPLHGDAPEAARQRFLARAVEVSDGRHGQSALRGTTRTPLFLLLGITGLVVLIACANIANLLLVRGAGRATEIAVRMSLGAARGRLVAQLLAESLALATLGALASILVAWGTLALVRSFLPQAEVGFGVTLTLGLRPSVIAFTGLVAFGTVLAFGLFPALHATRPDLIAAIRAGAGQVAGGQRSAVRFRTGLVTAQIALSMALLACAGLFVRSLGNVSGVRLGMDTNGVVQFALLPDFVGYPKARSHALMAKVEDALLAQPGVVAVSASGVPLFTGSTSGGDVFIDGLELAPDADRNVRANWIGPGFLRATGTPLLAGRAITAADRVGAPKVVLVNEAFLRKFALDAGTAVGRRLAVFGDPNRPKDATIVGVVRDAAYSGVKSGVPPMVYMAQRQDTTITAAAFYVRTSLPIEQALATVRRTVAGIDPTLPLPFFKPLSQQVRESVYLDRLVTTLSAGFAVLATLLAAVGLYGVLAYTVAQRTREIGVRMALGADAGRVRRLVLRQVGAMTAIGAAVGLLGALGLGRAAQSLLFGLDGRDPMVLGATTVVLVLVALAAGWLPARRAAGLSPVSALKSD